MAYHRKASALLALVAATETISVCTVIMNHYSAKRLPSDQKLNVIKGCALFSMLTLVWAVLALFQVTIPVIYEIWVVLSAFVCLIVNVLGIAILGSSSTQTTVVWIAAIVFTIVINGFMTNAVIPTVYSDEYADYTGSRE